MVGELFAIDGQTPMPYEPTLAVQDAMRAAVWRGEMGKMLLLEHSPVYTLGVRSRKTELSEEMVAAATGKPANVVRIRRGGQITYHGPGQLVGYLLVDLRQHGGSAKCFMHALEQVVMDATASVTGIVAGRNADHPGVWVGGRKIAAIGVSFSKHVSMHGFALNVDNSDGQLDNAFGAIVPCGINDPGLAVASLDDLVAAEPAATAAVAAAGRPLKDALRSALVHAVAGEFNLELRDSLGPLAESHRGDGAGLAAALCHRFSPPPA
ncbi:octanoyltransferase, partial [Thecamonas trahens ATCC 50062]